ncbi:hypothetical protein ABFS83_12G086900 [Erythranthe nasuta]
MSGPTIDAISVVFDHAEYEDVLVNMYRWIPGFCKDICMPSSSRRCFGLSSNVAVQSYNVIESRSVTVFTIANRHGDFIHTGWRNIPMVQKCRLIQIHERKPNNGRSLIQSDQLETVD